MLDAKIASTLNKIIQNSQFKKEGQSGGTESSERRSDSTTTTDRSKTKTSSKRMAKLRSTRSRKNGHSRLRQQKSRRKESLWWIPERVCKWSASETLTPLSWRQCRTSRSPTTVITANGKVQTRREATEHVKELDLFITVMLLDETPAVLSLGKLCEDHGYTYHWTSGQKPHLTEKWQKESIAINRTTFHSFSLVYQRVPLRHLHLLLQHLQRKIL